MLLLGFVFLFGAGYGTISIIRPLTARAILGEESFGSKSGFLAMVYLSGAASAPYFGALLWSLGGYDLVLCIVISLAFLGLILYVFARKLAIRTG